MGSPLTRLRSSRCGSHVSCDTRTPYFLGGASMTHAENSCISPAVAAETRDSGVLWRERGTWSAATAGSRGLLAVSMDSPCL